MKIFQCQACDQPVTFEATGCESCARQLGYLCKVHEVSALEPQGLSAHPLMGGAQVFHAYADPGRRYRLCNNAVSAACNWLVPEDSPDIHCTACRHNRVVPDLSQNWNLTRWRQIEAAKHRLFYSLLRLELPLATRAQYTDGLAFDFLVDPSESFSGGTPVLTGHINGLITMNIAEADDVERERRRILFGEHYRTLLGHFRHEIGHYFWYLLVMNSPTLDAFRALFGDERLNYVQALQDHYARGAPADWDESLRLGLRHRPSVGGLRRDLRALPAHRRHGGDRLDLRAARAPAPAPRPAAPTVIDFDPYNTLDLDRLIAAWLPLTYAINSLSHSMGQPALYPFKLTPTVIAKLAFVHERIYASRTGTLPDAGEAGAEMLRAVIMGLRQKVAAPTG
ncbi:zinc-binding metallopeptidase family protein [Methylobacterium oryzae CBMB20]